MTQILSSLGIVVLNPDSDPSFIGKTVKTANDYFPTASVKCIVGRRHADLPDIKRHCPVLVGGNTITSLMDVGLAGTKEKWCFVITSGTFFRVNTFKKYEYFVRGEKDVMFPVVERKWTFDEGTINGILFPTSVVKDVGEFGDDNDLTHSKLVWATRAMERGYQFKGLVGARLI